MSDYPPGWRIAQDFDPQTHLMQIERFDKKLNKKVATDYMTVQNRLIWFIRDQRALIEGGLATTTYTMHTEMVEHDREAGWAHFKTMVRDVLGNEATMYGSESVRDFPDYIEKASTKSLGRALLLLGYGTAFADELDEGERVVDAPVAAHAAQPPTRQAAQTAPAPPIRPHPAPSASPPVATQPDPAKTVPPMVAITNWITSNGLATNDLTTYVHRHQLNLKQVGDQQQVLAAMAQADQSAEFFVIGLARKHLTKIEVIERIMREEQIPTIAEFWRQYQANPEDWQAFLASYLQGLVTA